MLSKLQWAGEKRFRYQKAPGPHASADRALSAKIKRAYCRSMAVAVLAVTGAAVVLAEE